MGLYEELQKDIGDAFNSDLADATRILQFITIEDTYDADTMTSSQVETSVDVRAVVESDFESERVDEASRWNHFKLLVLDSDRNGVIFETDMVVKDGTDRYKIRSTDQDPAKATWTIYARRLG